MTKICSICKLEKNTINFSNRRTYCKKCSNQMNKEWKEKNKEKIAEYNKKYREENLEKVKAYYKKTDEEKDINRKERQQKYFTKFKKIVEKKGGIMLSTNYENAHSKLKIKCSNNHEFECSTNSLDNDVWCANCNIKINECITLCALEHLFQKQFIKIRPDWLKNKEGNNLEIDCFNEELKLCVEYNGKQHYEFIEFFHKTEEKFKKRQEDDKIKKEKCKEKNYVFIDIPYTISIENIINYIANKCIENNIYFNEKNIKTFDYSKIDISNKKHEELLTIIKRKNGELISGRYITNESIITLKCNKGHLWTTKCCKIKNDSWCHTCGYNINEDDINAISVGMTLYNQTEEGIQKKKESHQKRSETMAKQREDIRKSLTEKSCSKCKETKEISKYNKKLDTKDGLQPYCKSCITLAKKKSKENILI